MTVKEFCVDIYSLEGSSRVLKANVVALLLVFPLLILLADIDDILLCV